MRQIQTTTHRADDLPSPTEARHGISPAGNPLRLHLRVTTSIAPNTLATALRPSLDTETPNRIG